MKQQPFPNMIKLESQEELEALKTFRAKVKAMNLSRQYSDDYLLRFLRARKLDLDKTTKMWENFIKWRQDNDIDHVLDFNYEELYEVKKVFPHAYFGHTKKGNPIYIERLGQLKYDRIWEITSKERFYRYYVQGYERLVEEILPSHKTHQTMYILDLKDWSYKMMASGVFELSKSLSRIGQDYYPEVMSEMFIVNTPIVFHGVWNVVKFWVDEKTRKKVQVCGENFQSKLLERVDPDKLPDFLGGSVGYKQYSSSFEKEDGLWTKKKQCEMNNEFVGERSEIEELFDSFKEADNHSRFFGDFSH